MSHFISFHLTDLNWTVSSCSLRLSCEMRVYRWVCRWKTSRTWRRMRDLATAVSVGWQRASSTQWPVSDWPPTDTASDTTTAFSHRKFATVGRCLQCYIFYAGCQQVGQTVFINRRIVYIVPGQNSQISVECVINHYIYTRCGIVISTCRPTPTDVLTLPLAFDLLTSGSMPAVDCMPLATLWC